MKPCVASQHQHCPEEKTGFEARRQSHSIVCSIVRSGQRLRPVIDRHGGPGSNHCVYSTTPAAALMHRTQCSGYAGAQIVPRYATNVYYNCVSGKVWRVYWGRQTIIWMILLLCISCGICEIPYSEAKNSAARLGDKSFFVVLPAAVFAPCLCSTRKIRSGANKQNDALNVVLPGSFYAPAAHLHQCLVDENDKIRRDVCGCESLNPAEAQVGNASCLCRLVIYCGSLL